MNICLNYYGQTRNADVLKNTFNNFIYTQDDNIKYHILYTCFNDCKTDEFKEVFTESYIKTYEMPDLSNYSNIIQNYHMDIRNPNKTVIHYINGMYIKKMSYSTIDDFEKCHNIKFDMIITLRTDIYLSRHLSNYYYINNKLSNTVYVAEGPKFDVYPQPALADVICISDKEGTSKITSQIDILEHCCVINTNYFHPESSFYNALKYLNLNIVLLNFTAFPNPNCL